MMIDIEFFETEYQEANKSLVNICNEFGVKAENVLCAYEPAYEWIKNHCEAAKHLQARISKAERITEVRNREVYEITQLAVNSCKKTYRTAMRAEIQEMLKGFLARIAASRYLCDELSLLSDEEVKASQYAWEATQLFTRDVQTNIGWRNTTTFKSDMDYSEREIKQEQQSWGGVYRSLHIGIDHQWENVKENKIQIVDIAGKKCFTHRATEIKGHGLESEGVKLFEADIIYTKVPKTEHSRVGGSDFNKYFHFEKKYICVQPVTDGNPIIATGKDQSWAIRTMRGRMKKKLFEMLDV